MSTSVASRTFAKRRHIARLALSALSAIAGHGHAAAQSFAPDWNALPTTQVAAQQMPDGKLAHSIRNWLFRSSAGSSEKIPVVRLGVADVGRNMLMAEADEQFQLWQARANQKLKSEGESGATAEHMLAAQNPSDFIVVCEAGCRASSDRIVSRMSRKHQPLQAQVRQDDTQGSTLQAASNAANRPDNLPADNVLASTEITCIAGCATKPEPAVAVALAGDVAATRPPVFTKMPEPAREATRGSSLAAWLAGTEVIKAERRDDALSERQLTAPQTAYNGAIIGPGYATGVAGSAREMPVAKIDIGIRRSDTAPWHGAMTPTSNAQRSSFLRQGRGYRKIRGPYRQGAKTQYLFAR